MEQARIVLERLDRIEALDRSVAEPGALLAELRELLREAEDWVRADGGDAEATAAVQRLRHSLTSELAPH